MSHGLSRRQVFGVGGIGLLGLLRRCLCHDEKPTAAVGKSNCTVIRYDNLTRLTNGGQVVTVTYDGKPRSVADPAGSITTVKYSSYGRIG
jgi:hypothetical protein